MKKLTTLVGLIAAIVFLNPAQAKADVKAYVYFNPLSWFFTPPVKVSHKRAPVYHVPVRERIVYVKPRRNKRVRRFYRSPERAYKKRYSYNQNRYKKSRSKNNRRW